MRLGRSSAVRAVLQMMAGVLLVGALLGVGSPASAATVKATAQPSVTKVLSPEVAAANFNYACFGYTGNFKSGSSVIKVDWTANGSIDECFGIAPNRTVWHAWPGSGAWKVMPHNGLADDTDIAFRNSSGQHVVAVWVSGIGDYCSTLTSSWQPWVQCL